MEVAIRFFIITAKTAFIFLSVFSLIVLLTIITSGLLIALNWGVINDLMAILQMWLPFDMVVVFTWILTVGFAYIAYRLTMLAIEYMNNWLNN